MFINNIIRDVEGLRITKNHQPLKRAMHKNKESVSFTSFLKSLNNVPYVPFIICIRKFVRFSALLVFL